MTNEPGLSIDLARAAVAHFRDTLRLTNRDLAQSCNVDTDALVHFMNGDDSALTDAQRCRIGNELAPLVTAEDLDREELMRRYRVPIAGVREVIGFPTK
jgi:hypothetical protein